MLKIGLTGGIGCGKSAVANLFAAKGIIVLDADEIGRELVAPGQPALAAIALEFGDAVLKGGSLDRAKLRRLIYADYAAKRKLEALLHPLIYQALSERMQGLAEPYCILAIPLLIETGHEHFVDRILVVDCLPEQQYQRVRKRDGLDDAAIESIIQAQAGRDKRLAAADDVIDNTGSLEQLRQWVEALHLGYLAMAKKLSSTPCLAID